MSQSGSRPDPFTTRIEGPGPERQISRDLVKRGLFAGPLLVAISAAIWGMDGAVGALYGIGLVLVNFLLSAGLLSASARISLGLMMAAALFGYLIRLALIFVAVLVVRDASWISLTALGLTIIVTHLGLLFWELRYVSASLAFPGLKPTHASTN
ncbi:MAG: ATP synthase subunit I [Acidimicrobiia bacterium]